MPRSLRLLQVTPYAAAGPRFGGIPLSVRVTSDALEERGHHVTVWTSDLGANPGIDSESTNTGVCIRYFPAKWKSVGEKINSPIVPEIMLAGRTGLAEFDLIHMHGYWNLFAPSLARVASIAKVPFVVQPRGSLSEYALRGFAKRVFDFLFRRTIVSRTTLAIALTPAEKREMIARGFEESQTEVIPNFVTGPSFDLPTRKAARRHIGLPPNRPVILFLGRLHAAKGIERLISAFADVRRILPESILVVAGPDEGRLADLLGHSRSLNLPDVLFPGPLHSDLKWLALRAADVFCLPSRSEGFPRVLLEAMVVGTPVVLSNQVHIQYLAEEGAALFVNPTPKDLSESLVTVLRDSGLRSELVRHSQECLEKHFSKTIVTSHLEEAYLRAIDIRRGESASHSRNHSGRVDDAAYS
ncbi:MAG TPA: glycosyltransferase [Thermoplasmata archaeon]